ncbi:MAG: hypothetical protein R2932_52375 [Caldilineaceae bacterium]
MLFEPFDLRLIDLTAPRIAQAGDIGGEIVTRWQINQKEGKGRNRKEQNYGIKNDGGDNISWCLQNPENVKRKKRET